MIQMISSFGDKHVLGSDDTDLGKERKTGNVLECRKHKEMSIIINLTIT